MFFKESKQLLKLFILILAVDLFCTVGYSAEEVANDYSIEVSTDYVSKYIWRGIRLTNDPVSQNSITLSKGDFSLNIWGSVDSSSVNEEGTENWNLQEMDYTASYSLELDMLSFEVGYIYYDFPGTELGDTSELYFGICIDSILSPSLTVYRDIDLVNGWYVFGEVSHGISIIEDKLALNLSLAFAWGDSDYGKGYYGVNSSGADITLGASFDYQINEKLSSSIYVTYSDVIDKGYDTALGSYKGESTIGGINFTYSF